MDLALELELIERLKQKFTDFDIDFNVFCNLLIDNNAFISGSFLLQIIQNRFFDGEDYDIDIFTFGNKNIVLEKGIYTLIKNAIYKKTSLKKNKKVIFKNADDSDDYDDEISLFKNAVTIIDKYNGLNSCEQKEFLARTKTNDYGFDKIKRVVNFENTQQILCKHQLIYYDKKIYRVPKDIIANFDFDFCANYFDGKNIYVKNYDSIISASCTLNLKQQRIYRNDNNRIVKYVKRGYCINAKYCDDIYDISYLRLGENNDPIVTYKKSSDTKNLIIICDDVRTNIAKYINNLQCDFEKIIIYTYPTGSIINNLPISVQELRIYIWKLGTGVKTGNSTNLQNKYSKTIKNEINEKHQLLVKNAVDNIKKIPFNCKIFINDDEIKL